MTHTYVTLELSQAAYDEIAEKLLRAGYGHAFATNGEIDMHGLAVKRSPEQVDAGAFDFGALQELRKQA